jgi:hypothetical protein
MKAVVATLALMLLALPAQAQEIVQEPLCFGVRNEAPYKVYGNFGTDYYVAEDGTKARHRQTFGWMRRARSTMRVILRTGRSSVPTARSIRTGSWK